MVDSKTLFEVCAYDKDGGYYNTIYTTPSEKMAIKVAKAIDKLVKKDAYRNPSTNEPYDWVSVFHGDFALLIE